MEVAGILLWSLVWTDIQSLAVHSKDKANQFFAGPPHFEVSLGTQPISQLEGVLSTLEGPGARAWQAFSFCKHGLRTQASCQTWSTGPWAEKLKNNPLEAQMTRVSYISWLALASGLEPSGHKEIIPQILPDCSRVCVCPLGQIPRPTPHGG